MTQKTYSMPKEKGCGELTIPFGYCDGKDYLCDKCCKQNKDVQGEKDGN